MFAIKIKKLLILIVILLLCITVFQPVQESISVLAGYSVKVPIIMYHHVLKDSRRWNKYVISPNELEKDLQYIKEEGYTTIVMQDLIDFVYNGKDLPEKPIMLTFDDGHYSNFEYVVPLLEKYEFKAVISIVGSYVDKSTQEGELNVNYSYFNWDVVKELVDSPYVEIQNHSYNMHEIKHRKGCIIMENESYKKYKEELLNDVGKLQNLIHEHTGYKPNTFTYPFGFVCWECNEILREAGFVASLSCFEGINILTKDKSELFELKRFNRPHGVNREEFFKKILK